MWANVRPLTGIERHWIEQAQEQDAALIQWYVQTNNYSDMLFLEENHIALEVYP